MFLGDVAGKEFKNRLLFIQKERKKERKSGPEPRGFFVAGFEAVPCWGIGLMLFSS